MSSIQERHTTETVESLSIGASEGVELLISEVQLISVNCPHHYYRYKHKLVIFAQVLNLPTPNLKQPHPQGQQQHEITQYIITGRCDLHYPGIHVGKTECQICNGRDSVCVCQALLFSEQGLERRNSRSRPANGQQKKKQTGCKVQFLQVVKDYQIFYSLSEREIRRTSGRRFMSMVNSDPFRW